MPRVQNLSKKGIPLLRWRVLPDGRVLDPTGKVHDELPADVGYSDQAKRLCRRNLLRVEGINWFLSEAENPQPKLPPDPAMPEMMDDLTELINIGKGRARKLEGVGVTTFTEVVELGAADLGNLLDITRELAEEVVTDAAGRVR